MALSRIKEPHALMPRRKLARIALLVLAFLTTPMISRADIGIPMIAISYPIMIYLLIGVVAIETVYLRRTLHTSWKKTLSATAFANIITTILGYPFVWAGYLIFEFIVGYILSALDKFHIIPLDKFLNSPPATIIGVITTAAWLGPSGPNADWPVMLAFAVLLIPSFFLSGFIEARFVSKRLSSDPKDPSVRRGVWRANIASYIFLLIAGLLSVLYLLRKT